MAADSPKEGFVAETEHPDSSRKDDSPMVKSSPGKSIRAADALPPVERPDPGLILKLFFVPGLIVFIVVLLVLGVTALVNLGSDPLERLAAIERGAANAWQEAESIANELRSSEELRRNADFNARMSALLERKLAEPLSTGDETAVDTEIKLRYFLCKCLGEFEIADSLPVLFKAGTPPDSGQEDQGYDVRLAAIESIALLTHNVRQAGGDIPTEEVIQFLGARSREGGAGDQELGPIRSRAAFALGVVGGERAEARLEEMLTLEFYPDARFNAATGLARWGNPVCVETLTEMIDPDNTAVLNVEQVEAARDLKRWTVQFSGIKAAELLAEKNPQADLSALAPMAEKLRQVEDLPVAIDQQAKQLQLILDKRTP